MSEFPEFSMPDEDLSGPRQDFKRRCEQMADDEDKRISTPRGHARKVIERKLRFAKKQMLQRRRKPRKEHAHLTLATASPYDLNGDKEYPGE